MNNTYNDYMNAFSSIPKEEKRKEIINTTKELQDLIFKLSHDSELVLPANIEQLEKSPDEEEYYQAVYAHLVCLEELLANYLDKIVG